MKRRKWDAKPKAIIVLEGLKGKPVTAICQDYHISHAQYLDEFVHNQLLQATSVLARLNKREGGEKLPLTPGCQLRKAYTS